MADLSNILALLGIGASVAGTMTQTIGSYRRAEDERKAAEWQARVAENNATLADWEARDALERGEEAWQSHRLKVAALKGTQRASFAARGISLSEGSPLRILTDTDFLGELDANIIRRNAGRESYGYRKQAQQYRDDAELYRYQRESISPALQGATSLLTGAGSVASKWYAYSEGASGWQVGEA